MAYHNSNQSVGDSAGGNDSDYATGAFVKEKDGVVAPVGFHYMPNGKLMSDADHIAIHGYIEKKITKFDINAKDINYLGEIKSFTIIGDKGAVFSLEVYDDAAGSPTAAPNYYNFSTKTWSSSKYELSNVELSGSYSFSVEFPSVEFTDATCDYNNDPTIAHDDDDGKIVAGMLVTGTGIPTGATVSSVTSDTAFELSASTTGGAVTNGTLTFSGIKKYTINLYAKTVSNIRTKHNKYIEVKNIDGTLDVNKSIGSNSDLLRRIIYQDVPKNLYLSCIAPSLTQASTDIVNGSIVGGDKIIVDGITTVLSNIAVGDKVTGTGISAASHVLITAINPDRDNENEIQVNQNVSISNDVVMTVTPAFNGMTPNGVVSTTGQQAYVTSSGANFKTSFSITCTALAGRTLTAFKTPTTSDLCAYTTVTFGSAALAIPGEDVSSSTYYRWPITNIAKLQGGMSLDPARRVTGLNTTTPATISNYSSTITSSQIVDRKYYTDVESTTITDVFVDGVDSSNNPITAIDRTGVATAQEGNITFNIQQADALKSDSGVRIFAYGAKGIKSLTGIEVVLSDVVITPTQISTTTTGAVSNSVTIPVTEAGNISTLNKIRGIGIAPSVVNPTVSLKSAATGGANLTASAAQTLESGQTLYFDGASNIVTITGNIEISKMGISDTTLYLDVEKFLKAI